MKQSAVGWIIDQLFELRNPTLNQIEIVKKAREIEKQQQDEFAIGFTEWKEINVQQNNDGFYYGESRIGVSRKNPVNIHQLLEIYKKEKQL